MNKYIAAATARLTTPGTANAACQPAASISAPALRLAKPTPTPPNRPLIASALPGLCRATRMIQGMPTGW